MSGDLLSGDVRPIPKRGLNEETCRKFGYMVGAMGDKTVQIANYRDADGQVVAQKVRDASKDFTILGNAKAMRLYGEHLWQAGGKRIVVTEGEIDALSVAQVFNLSWPVVSVPNGAQSAKKALQKSLEFLESFEEVVLAFDMDDEGRKASAECALLFTPGRCRIAEMPLKDANAMLLAGKVKELCGAIYQARVYRPDGVINGSELWERILAKQEPGVPYPWPALTAKTLGQHPGRLTMWTAGSGIGKSTVVAKVAYDLAFKHGRRVGYVALEEDAGQAAQRFLSNYLGKLVHVPGQATQAEMRTAFDATLASGRIWLLDHFGSSDADNLLSKLRYLAKGCECDVLILDHVSIAVSGMGIDGDERRLIDYLMTALRTLVEETGVMMHAICHLRRSAGDGGHEEGGRVTLAQLRGSAAIAQLSDTVIGIERNLQDEEDRDMVIRVLKNRVNGDTGLAGKLNYNRDTGELTEVEVSGFEEVEGGSDF